MLIILISTCFEFISMTRRVWMLKTICFPPMPAAWLYLIRYITFPSLNYWSKMNYSCWSRNMAGKIKNAVLLRNQLFPPISRGNTISMKITYKKK